MKTINIKYILSTLILFVTASCFNMNSKLGMMEEKEDEIATKDLPALHRLIKYGKIDSFECFLDQINKQDKLGRTPLHMAVEAEREDMIERLIQLGASLEIRDNEGRTPFYLAIKIAENNDNNAPIKALLQENGHQQIYCTDVTGANALHIAAKLGDSKVAYWLLENYFKIDAISQITDLDGNSFLHCAASKGQIEFLKNFLNEDSKDITNYRGQTLLHVAGANGQTDTWEFLVDFGFATEVFDYQDKKPILNNEEIKETEITEFELDTAITVKNKKREAIITVLKNDKIIARMGIYPKDDENKLESKIDEFINALAILKIHLGQEQLDRINVLIKDEKARSKFTKQIGRALEKTYNWLIKHLGPIAEKLFGKCINLQEEENEDKMSIIEANIPTYEEEEYTSNNIRSKNNAKAIGEFIPGQPESALLYKEEEEKQMTTKEVVNKQYNKTIKAKSNNTSTKTAQKEIVVLDDVPELVTLSDTVIENPYKDKKIDDKKKKRNQPKSTELKDEEDFYKGFFN